MCINGRAIFNFARGPSRYTRVHISSVQRIYMTRYKPSRYFRRGPLIAAALKDEAGEKKKKKKRVFSWGGTIFFEYDVLYIIWVILAG